MDTSGNVVFDYEVTGSAASSINTGAILNGDVDGWYTIIARLIGGNNGARINLRPNNDSGNNYGRLGISATDTVVVNASATGEAYSPVGYVSTANYTSFNICTMYAKSGSVRLCNNILAHSVTGTTVTALVPSGFVWNNTADNITSMTFASNAANDLAVGTRIIILKGNALAVGTSPGTTGAWKRVGTSVLGSAASSVTFSGLDGDTAVLYYVSSQIKGGYAGTAQPVLLPNNATTNTVYGYQRLTGASTTVAAGRITTGFIGFHLPYYTANTNYTMNTNLIFAKSGFVRPDISLGCSDISGTTVTRADIYGDVWNNTSDNITSLVITTDKANGLAAGSQFDLYALYT